MNKKDDAMSDIIKEAFEKAGWTSFVAQPAESKSVVCKQCKKSGNKVIASNGTQYKSVVQLAYYLNENVGTMQSRLRHGAYTKNGVTYRLLKQQFMKFERPRKPAKVVQNKPSKTDPKEVIKNVVISLINKDDYKSANALLEVLDKIN